MINIVSNAPAEAALTPTALRGGSDGAAFARALHEAQQGATDNTSLRKAATEFVSIAFVQPVLASMRNSPFAQDGPFAPGTAERRFMPLLHEKMAERITSASRFPLVDAVVDHIRSAVAPPGVPAGAARLAEGGILT